MQIKCTYEQLQSALSKVNENYDGNIEFKDGTPERQGKAWRVRLGVKDSKGPGAHLSIRYWFSGQQHLRRSNSACWHVHGEFFDALPEGTSIRTRGETTHAGGGWNDFNVGSMMFPVYASESCLCEGEVSISWAKSSYEKSKAY